MIKTRLYNKSVEIVFYNEGNAHAYYINGQRLLSVTTILNVVAKPKLINWAAKMAVESMQQSFQPGIAYDEVQLKDAFALAKKAHWQKKMDAGDIGTMVHKWIESYIKGEKPKMPINEQMNISVNQFLKWIEEYNVKFLLSEQIVYSKIHRYVGTLDFVAKVNGKLILGDLKTSSGIWDEYFLQLAAYRLARIEEYPSEKYEGSGIIRVGKDGIFEWQQIEEWEHHAKAFLAAKTLYEVLERMKREKLSID